MQGTSPIRQSSRLSTTFKDSYDQRCSFEKRSYAQKKSIIAQKTVILNERFIVVLNSTIRIDISSACLHGFSPMQHQQSSWRFLGVPSVRYMLCAMISSPRFFVLPKDHLMACGSRCMGRFFSPGP